jgi:hypothetical protein
VINHPLITFTRIESLERSRERTVKGLGFVATVRRQRQHMDMIFPAEIDCRERNTGFARV